MARTAKRGVRRKRIPRVHTPIQHTSVGLPKDLRRLFDDLAAEWGYTLSRTILEYLLDTLTRKTPKGTYRKRSKR
jgi:hypothetical protein